MTCRDGHATAKTSIVMHHAVSDDMVNWSDYRVQKWFSDVGRNRGYAGVAHSYHCDPSGSWESFAQAQYCLHRYTNDGNKYGWRLTQLIKDPFQNACWHASNWTINKSSIGIETAGNFVSKRLDEKALMLIADTFRYWDKNLNGGLQIYGHRQFAATACPGLIFEQIPALIDMFNNPDKWNKKLFPAPSPPPVNDNLYKVRKGGKQIGAYKIRDNAFDKWYTEKASQVLYNGKDLTSVFRAEMNVLEKKIDELEGKVNEKETAVEKCIIDKGKLSEKADELSGQVDDLNKANQKRIDNINEMKGVFNYLGTDVEFVEYLEDYKTKCESEAHPPDVDGIVKRFLDWLLSLFKKDTDSGADSSE